MIYLPVLITHKEALTALSNDCFNSLNNWILIVEIMAKLIILLIPGNPECTITFTGQLVNTKQWEDQNITKKH